MHSPPTITLTPTDEKTLLMPFSSAMARHLAIPCPQEIDRDERFPAQIDRARTVWADM